MPSLFGDEFEIKLKEPVVKDLIKKSKTKKEVVIDPEKILKSKKTSLVDRLAIIKDNVLKVLGRQKDKVLVIKDKQTFENYITEAIKVGRIAIDTETNNSLVIPGAKLMGLCLYYPGAKQAYIPINHTDLEGNRLAWQCTEQDCKEQLQKILDAKTFRVFHNAKFDYKVIKTTCNIEVTADWDTFIAAKLLDENEFSAGLKQQYISKIDPSQEKYSIDHLFENVEYAVVDPDIFALYAATDSMMTDALYLWQKPRMEVAEQENPQLNFYKLFKEVEMPCIQVVAEMELNGVLFDTEYADRLRVKFEKQLTEIDNKIAQELANIQPTIATWKETKEAKDKSKTYLPAKSKMTAEKIEATYPFIDENGNRYKESKAKRDQLEDPVNMASPTQLAILLYDILGAPVVDKESPRGTGEEVLQKLKATIPLCGLLLERRGVVKLLDAFINSLPEEVNPLTGKIHCSFNQYGAATGRFSSSQPNLQQIPSHLKTIRMLFRADPGYKLIGSDFSQQEPRLLSYYSQDDNMINAYKQGKDLYATIAMGIYKMGYWDCMEHHEDGSPNPEGKKRRTSVKAILLGIMYGRGAAAIAEQIHGTKEEAQKIVDDFYTAFPKVKIWMDQSLTDLKKNGYVEDFYGRRRRLPEINLPSYEIKLKDPKESTLFNPFINCQDREIEDEKIKKWKNKVQEKIQSSQIAQRNRCMKIGKVWQENDEMSNQYYEQLAAEALKDGVILQANTGRRAQASRQCVNARIQGGAATMTKIAMNKIFRDLELNSYGFKLLIGVHDELIGQCKAEYAEKCADRLCEVMKTCVADIVTTPFKCDPAITVRWYEDEMAHILQDKKASLINEGKTEQEAFDIICQENTEFLTSEIVDLLNYKD